MTPALICVLISTGNRLIDLSQLISPLSWMKTSHQNWVLGTCTNHVDKQRGRGVAQMTTTLHNSYLVYSRYYCSWEGPYEMHSLSPHQMHFTVVSDSNLHKWLWHLPALLLKFELNWTIQKFPAVYYYHYVTYVKYAWVHSMTVNLLYVMSFFLKLNFWIVLVPSVKIWGNKHNFAGIQN